MKLAVFSDTHGRNDGMLAAARRMRPDLIVHLGDHIRDSLELAHELPDTPLYAVAGNCDFSSREPDRMSFMLGTTQVFATHGHAYAVKYTLDPLLNAAHFAGAKLVLYGHTHIARIDYFGDMTVVNPGSAGLGRSPSFALIELKEDGSITARILDI